MQLVHSHKMQSWQNIGHNNGQVDQPTDLIWHSQYVIGPNDEAQLREPTPSWPQAISGQVAYPGIEAQRSASHEPFFTPNQVPVSTLHGHPQHDTQHSFHGDHSHNLGQPFPQAGTQGMMDEAFGDAQPDLFQGPKYSFQDGLAGISQTSPHSHSQAYVSDMFPFVGPDGPSFDTTGPSGAYSGPQLHQQQIPASLSPFSTSQAFARPPIAQHGPQPQYRHTPSDLQHASYSNHFAQQQYPEPSQQLFRATPTLQRQDHDQPKSEAAIQVHKTQGPTHSPTPTIHGPQVPQVPQSPLPTLAKLHPAEEAEAPGGPVAKKRKPMPKKAPTDVGTGTAINPSQSPVSFPAVAIPAKANGHGEMSSVSTRAVEETQTVARARKRKAPERLNFPCIAGLPHLISTRKEHILAPKSYDKLAPLVAIPSRSGKPMVPELGYELPCEVQGRFSQKYKPSLEKIGNFEERRLEADTLLREYERDMRKLGKRRPKYTEYPYSFKEQLKADEALKTKAQRQAKKESRDDINKLIRPESRPADAVEAAAWDIIGIVHFEPSVARTHAVIAKAVQQAGELIIKLRGAMARAKQEQDQAKKEKRTEGEMAELKKSYEAKREALFRALDAANERGDEGVLENLGGHQKLVMALVNILIVCIKGNDFSSKLPKAVLELMSNFFMTKKVADNANFEVVRKRLADKGDDEVREILEHISSRIRITNSSTGSQKKTDGNESPPPRRLLAASAKAPVDGPSAKRSRDDDTETRAIKKVIIESSNSLGKKLGTPKAVPTTKATVASLLGKNRPVAKPVQKPEAAADASTKFAQKPDSKASAVKTDVPRQAVAKPDQSKQPPPPPPPRASSGTSALSSIASILDSINAPKPDPKPGRDPKSVVDPDETPEQKAKRLHKEARRKLKVSWKEGDELVQVRIFHKEAAEDEGRSRNLTRDAADDKSEGMVLKQRATLTEDDEDEDELPYQPWVSPAPLDLSAIPAHYRRKTYVTRGGTLQSETQEQKLVAEREQRELMVIYTDVADIPPTPRSPPPETAAPEAGEVGKVGRLPDMFEETLRRWSETERLGHEMAAYHATQRLEAAGMAGPDRSIGPAPSASGLPLQKRPTAEGMFIIAGTFEEQMMFLLQSDRLRNWKETVPFDAAGALSSDTADTVAQAASQAAAASLSIVSASLSGEPYPPSQPPEWLSSEEKIREWWMGYNRDEAEKARRDTEQQARIASATAAAASQLQAQGIPVEWATYYAQQQQVYAPYMALLQQMQSGKQQAPTTAAPGATAQTAQINNAQLQSIFAQLNPSAVGVSQPAAAIQQPLQAQAGQPVMGLNPNDPAHSSFAMLRQLTQAAKGTPTMQPQAWSGEGTNSAGDEWDRDQDLDHDHDHDNGQDRDRNPPRSRRGRDRERRGEGGDTRGGGATKKASHKVVDPALFGTKSCTFWKRGECARGDGCTFRHD